MPILPSQPVVLPRASRLFYGLAAFVIIIAGMRASAPLLNNLFLAILLAMVFSPLLNWLQCHGLSRRAAILGTLLLVLGGGAALSMLLGASISRLLSTLPAYEPRMAELRQAASDFLSGHRMDLAEMVRREDLNPRRLLEWAIWLVTLAGRALAGLLLVLLLMAMMLVEAPALGQCLAKGPQAQSSIVSRFLLVGGAVHRYVALIGWLGLINAALNLVLLLALRVEAPLLWAVLSFLLCFVPVIGNLLALTPPALMALLQFGWERALVVVVGYILTNSVIDYIVRPRFLRHGVGMSPLTIVLALLFWAWVLGPPGAIVAIPLTLVVRKLVLESYHETQTLAALMGDTETKGPLGPTAGPPEEFPAPAKSPPGPEA